MTRREKREQSEWRRCVFCGRYIGFSDFHNNKVVNESYINYGYEKDDFEECVAYSHLFCAEKYQQRQEAINVL